jgi:lipopolysaccharide exporter
MSRFSNVFFGFINFYLLIRILDKAEFGVWILYISVSTTMELIKNGFIIGPMVRAAVIADREEYTRILSASLMLNIIVTLCQIVIVFIVSFFIDNFWDTPQSYSMLLFYSLTALLLIPIGHCSAVQQSNYNFKADFFTNVSRQFSFFLFVLCGFIFAWNFSFIQLASLSVLSTLASALVGLITIRSRMSFSWAISKKWMKELAQYGKYTFGTNISTTIMRNVDSWLLGGLIGPAAVTLYNPAMRVANIVEVPTVSLSAILFPKLLARFGKEGPKAARDMYEKSVAALFAFMLPIVIFCVIFARPIIVFIAGPDFEETVFILRVVMLTGLIIPFNRQVGITLDAIGLAKMNFVFVLRNALFNLVVTYFYINAYGVIGAAYGLLTTFTMSFTFNQIYIRYKLQVSFWNIMKNSYQYYRKVIQYLWNTITGSKKQTEWTDL